jgi:formamidopyrimidine-DNA glycosylase
MPELPEVRTVVKFLNTLKGNHIRKIESYLPKMFSSELVDKVTNEKINEVTALGKYIIFHLDNYNLISHLRMEGKYFYKDYYEKTKHDHVIFTLDKGYLYYNDVRKFGTFDLKNKEETFTTPPLSNLGKEPFTITVEELNQKLKKSSRAIKTLLLDQSIMTGIGNIYADEILFLSKINPKTRGLDITISQIKELIKNSIKVLNEAIKEGGTTIHTFSTNEGQGWFQLKLNVHTKAGKPCKICNTIIKKEKINGRMSYYCETCQR